MARGSGRRSRAHVDLHARIDAGLRAARLEAEADERARGVWMAVRAGASRARIGAVLGVTRERVRQLMERGKALAAAEEEA